MATSCAYSAPQKTSFTQSFVVPYIIPMLENAGAARHTPRERDLAQPVIVDNNTVTGKAFI